MASASSSCKDLAAQTLREPAQSKGTWTCHKSHFRRELTGKMPRPQNLDLRFAQACAIEMHMGMSQEPF